MDCGTMTGFDKVFIDTSPFIYLLDDDPNYGPLSRQIFRQLLDSERELYTSVITCEEYLIAPYKARNVEKENAFFSFLADCGIEIRAIDRATAMNAAIIRAEYRFFKPMDALQLAAACQAGCGLFLTNDKQLLQFHQIKCVTLDSFST